MATYQTVQQAAAAFKGPRTYKAPDGSVKRTRAYADFLAKNGLIEKSYAPATTAGSSTPPTTAASAAPAPAGHVPQYQPPTMPATTPIDLTQLSSYVAGAARIDLDATMSREQLQLQQQQAAAQLALGRAQAQNQLADAAARLGRGKQDVAHETEKSTKGMVNEMNLGNLLFSGARDEAQSDINYHRDQALWNLEQNYGAPFRKQIELTLKALDQQYGSGFAAQVKMQMDHIARNAAIQKEELAAVSKENWNRINPAPPTGTGAEMFGVGAAPAPAAVAPAAAPKIVRTPYDPAKHVGRVPLSNGQWAPLVRTPNGGTAIDPTWQKWLAANPSVKRTA